MCSKKSFPTILEMEKKTAAILTKYDLQENNVITLHEYLSIIKKDPDILSLLKGFGFLLSDDIRIGVNDEKSLVECDSDLDNEVFSQDPSPGIAFKEAHKENTEIINHRVENIKKANSEMIGNEAFRPTAYRSYVDDPSSPDLVVEPVQVHGFNAFGSRNKLKISNNSDLVTISGASAWVTNKKVAQHQQKIFQNHKQAISCIANNESFFATGEMGPDPVIHVWDCKTLAIKFTLSGILKEGVTHICFSNDGKKLAAMERAESHSVVIYDFTKLQSGKVVDLSEQVLGIFSGPKSVTSANQARL